MSYETITYETPEKGIGILSLNRPKAYNAVNQKMVEEKSWRASGTNASMTWIQR